MSAWIVYSKNGEARCEARNLQYSGEFLGACNVSVDIVSPVPIWFELGDWLEYRGERFEINYDPSVVKNSSYGSYGEGFVYEDVVFNSLSDELTRCDFLDYVPSDNEIHYSSLPTFSFFADSIGKLAERIQVNLDRIYTGDKKWTVVVHPEYENTLNVNISVNNNTVWDALGFVNSKFGASFIIRNRTITIGTTGVAVGNVFSYGKGNGLYKIERNAESNQKIITRLRAYGSTRNMPSDYYRRLGLEVFGTVSSIISKGIETSPYIELILDLPYSEDYFLKDADYNGKLVVVRMSDLEIRGKVTKDATTGKCKFYSEIKGSDDDNSDEPNETKFLAFREAVTEGAKIYFTTYVNKEAFPFDNKEYVNNVPNNMVIKHLMLPSFPVTHDPYIDSKNIEEIGIREGTVFFDGSSDLEEIYPTMEGMTAEDLAEAGIIVSATGSLDEVFDAEQITDDGKFEPAEGESEVTIPGFTITLKDIGFDINDYISTSSATISMKDGMCGGRDFEIVSCEKSGDNYVLTCKRHHDEGLDLYFPYNSYQIKSGDKFVLLNIEMPDVYIKAASERLLVAAKAYLAKNDYVRYSYTLTVDNVFMARQHDEAIANGTISIHDTIKEGDIMLFEDNDLGFNGGVTVASLSIKESSDDKIPQYEVTLKDEKTVGTLEKIQNQISSIINGNISIGSGAELNASQLQSLIAAYGDKLFIRKDKSDSTPYSLGIGGVLSVGKGATIKGTTETDDVIVNESVHSKEFIGGFTGGKGWAIRLKEYLNSAGVTEKRAVAEFDDVIVRGVLRVFEFVISQMLGENDNRTFTGMMEVDHFDPETGRVWLDTQDGRLYNTFRKDDIILVQQYNGMPSEENDFYITKQYELIIDEVGVGDLSLGEDRLDWVTFRNFASPMEGAQVDIITKGDTFVRIDNLTDPNRKGIIQIMTVGEDTPYMDVIYGAKTDPDNSVKARFGNLQAIQNPLFGWLKDFGAYIANLYAVGEFRIAHTGEDVADKIEMVKGAFRTNFSRTYFEMKDGDNHLMNGSFGGDLEGWTLGESSTDFLTVDGVAIYANRNLMTANTKFVGRSVYNDKNMLRILNSDITQPNASIQKFGTHKEFVPMDGSEEEPSHEYVDVRDKAYLIMRFFCDGDGTVEVGFDNGDIEDGSLSMVSMDVVKRTDEYLLQAEGTWNNEGNFVIRSTADIYVEFVTLTDRPLENLTTTTETWMEQDAGRIALLGQKIDKANGSISYLGIELNAEKERIDLYVEKTENIEGTLVSHDSRITLSEARIDAVASSIKTDSSGNITNISKSGLVLDSEFASMFSTQVNSQGVAKTAQLSAYVLETDLEYLVSKIEISADQINLTGAVTYYDLSSSLRNELDDKATSSELEVLQESLDNSIYELNSTVEGLQTEMSEKATVKALNDYVKKLTESIATKADTDLANAVVSGYTFINNGLIRTNYIDVDNLVTKKLRATDGTYTFALNETGFTIVHPSASEPLWSLTGNASYGSYLQMRNIGNSRWVYLNPGHMTLGGSTKNVVIDIDDGYLRLNGGMVIRNFGIEIGYDFELIYSSSYAMSSYNITTGRVLFKYFTNKCQVSGLAAGTVECYHGTMFIYNGSSWYHFKSYY